jgi:hypothetical protein
MPAPGTSFLARVVPLPHRRLWKVPFQGSSWPPPPRRESSPTPSLGKSRPLFQNLVATPPRTPCSLHHASLLTDASPTSPPCTPRRMARSQARSLPQPLRRDLLPCRQRRLLPRAPHPHPPMPCHGVLILRSCPLIDLLLRHPRRGSRPPRLGPLSIAVRCARTSALRDIMNHDIFHACTVSFPAPASKPIASPPPTSLPPPSSPETSSCPSPTTPASRASRWWPRSKL